MDKISKFYEWGNSSGNKKYEALAKKIVYEDEVSIEATSDTEYSLLIDGNVVGTFSVLSAITDATYDSETHIITITFSITDGSTKTIEMDVTDLVDEYKAGDGLKLDEDTFSVVIDENSDEYLSVSSDGILLSGIKDDIDAEASAREAADNTLTTSIASINSSISSLTTQIDSIKTSISELEELVAELTENSSSSTEE